jgi:hypothetical protein
MKKPVYLIFAVLFALAVFGCEPDDEPPVDTTERFDSRLLGGKWSTPDEFYDNVAKEYDYKEDLAYTYGYFRFFINGTPQMYTKGTNLNDWYQSMGYDYYQCEVYTKDGVIYRASDNKKLLQYTFETRFPFDTYNHVGITSVWQRLCDVAANGDMVTYSIFKEDGTKFTSTRPNNTWYLIRFPE